MSNSATNLDLLSSTQAAKEAVANALFDAGSPATLWGRRASTCSGLTFGYYGGNFQVGATSNAIADGTLALTASATNYVYASATTGAVSVNTTGFPAGSVPLYSVVAGASTVTSYTDLRSYQPSAAGGAQALATLADVEIASPADGQILMYSAAQGKWENSTFSSLFGTWFSSLPTTLPASSGQFWNNGGTLSQS